MTLRGYGSNAVELAGPDQRVDGSGGLQPLTYAAFALVGAGPELLSVVDSIDDTLSDEDGLNFLLEINAERPVIVDASLDKSASNRR